MTGKYDVFLNFETIYTVPHRVCGQFRPYVHENFEKFERISNPTARHRRNPFEFFKIFHEHRDETVHTLDGTQYRPLLVAGTRSRFAARDATRMTQNFL